VGTLSLRSDLGKRETWDENRSALGHVVLRSVGAEGYLAVAAAYEGLLTLTDRVPGESRDADLTPDQRWAVGRTFLALCRAISYLGLIIDLPPVWNLVSRRRLKRNHRASVEKLTEQVLAQPHHRDFMAQFGGDRPARAN
jgi:hypothetical protein